MRILWVRTLLAKCRKVLVISFLSSLKICSKVKITLLSLYDPRVHRDGHHPLHGETPAYALSLQNSLWGLPLVQAKTGNILRNRKCLHLFQKHPVKISFKTLIAEVDRAGQQRWVSLELRHTLLHQSRIDRAGLQLDSQFIVVPVNYPKIMILRIYLKLKYYMVWEISASWYYYKMNVYLILSCLLIFVILYFIMAQYFGHRRVTPSPSSLTTYKKHQSPLL